MQKYTENKQMSENKYELSIRSHKHQMLNCELSRMFCFDHLVLVTFAYTGSFFNFCKEKIQNTVSEEINAPVSHTNIIHFLQIQSEYFCRPSLLKFQTILKFL